jgi:cytochrome c biogenesis protein CcdA/thiol-disulfide isomerase/thioredoxin
MLLVLLSFLGGALTILSPCILPVLPFVFARSEQPFVKSTLPLLFGMALTFATIATLAAIGGSWAVRVNAVGRIVALVLLAAFGVALLSRSVADRLTRPFVALGSRLLESSGSAGANAGAWSSFVLGVATGFLWAPCAGPILGLVLTGAALNGANAQTSLLLVAYAVGAITSLALATLAGGRVFAALKRSFHAGEWVRRGLGVAVLVAVAAIALGWDTGVLTRLSYASTNRIEQSLIDKLQVDDPHDLPVEGTLPPFDGATAWLNSPPLTAQGLRGKVVVIDFWTYSCINCLRALPYTKAWYERYRDDGLVVIGVHAPEFAFEKDEGNVRRAVEQLGVRYPVALDNDFAIWKSFNNRYWPAHYFIDAQGQVRGHHFGEGGYEESERLVRALLMEAGNANLPAMSNGVESAGVEMAADLSNKRSPETYVGYGRAENFTSDSGFERDAPKTYVAPATLQLNQWALDGRWTAGRQRAVLGAAPGRIEFRFQARDLHLVLGPAEAGQRVRFRVTLDGAAPGASHGIDVAADGQGAVTDQRLYQLIRQTDGVREHTFAIEFLDPGVHAYAFTFG